MTVLSTTDARKEPTAMTTLDLSTAPPVPPAIEDLWDGWGFHASDVDDVELPDYNGNPGMRPNPALAQGIGAALRGVTTIVNATSTDSKDYRVGLHLNEPTASTDTRNRVVRITAAALRDARLPEPMRLAVTSAMAIHEAGHMTRECKAHQTAIGRAFPGDPLAQRVSNVLCDVHLEARKARDYPGYAGLFKCGLWWVASRHPIGAVQRLGRTTDERFGFAVSATRYGDYVVWGTSPDVTAERGWWSDWAGRTSPSETPADHVALVTEALERIRPDGLSETEDEPQGGGSGDGEPGDGDPQPGEGGDGQPEPGKGEPGGDGPSGDGEDTGHEFHGESDEPEPDFDPNAPTGKGYAQTTADDTRTSTTNPDGTVDALTDPLPVHVSEDVTSDDRNRDIFIGSTLEHRAKAHTDHVDVTIGTTRTRVTIRKQTRIRTVTVEPASSALRAAFVARKTSHEARTIARSGRLSPNRAYRVRLGMDTVFTRSEGRSPDRLDVHLLVDASGSMDSLIDRAASLAANLTSALVSMRTVRVHVWAHNTTDGVTLWDCWDSRKGGPFGTIGGIKSAGSNRDGSAIAGVAAIAKRDRTQRERTIIVVISDGAPCEPENYVRTAVDSARKDGTAVVSVAIEGGLTHEQEACYGRDAVVTYNPDFGALGRAMAVAIGKLA